MKIRFILGLILFALLAGCVGPFYEKDFGKNISLPVGTPFEIRLEGDPDSNFAWKINQLDTNVVMMVLRPEFTPFSGSEKEGGIYSFYFQTVGEGETQLEMVYSGKGSDTGEDQVAKTFAMSVESRI